VGLPRLLWTFCYIYVHSVGVFLNLGLVDGPYTLHTYYMRHGGALHVLGSGWPPRLPSPTIDIVVNHKFFNFLLHGFLGWHPTVVLHNYEHRRWWWIHEPFFNHLTFFRDHDMAWIAYIVSQHVSRLFTFVFDQYDHVGCSDFTSARIIPSSSLCCDHYKMLHI
jgi:hypothetical protein